MGRVSGCPGFIVMGKGVSSQDGTLICYHFNCQPAAEYLYAIRHEIKHQRVTVEQVKAALPPSGQNLQSECVGWKLAAPIENGIIIPGTNVDNDTKRPIIVACDHRSCDLTVYWKYVAICLVARGQLDPAHFKTIHEYGWGKKMDQKVANADNIYRYLEDYQEPVEPYLWHPTYARIIKR
jgi:hypothetical protein